MDAARRVAVVRELTKVHEEVWRGTLAEAAAVFGEHPIRGEVVLVIGGAPPAGPVSDEAIDEAVRQRLAAGPDRGPRQIADAIAGELQRSPTEGLRGGPPPERRERGSFERVR